MGIFAARYLAARSSYWDLFDFREPPLALLVVFGFAGAWPVILAGGALIYLGKALGALIIYQPRKNEVAPVDIWEGYSFTEKSEANNELEESLEERRKN